ncbi:MAG TPA: hypothetical protein VMV59_08155 [Candidatus Dormibacteraeota bacterium]|nr:hypothetical protein [Candidatus Dormibacteraeota bacterium]
MKKLLFMVPVLLLVAVLLAPAQISERWLGGNTKWVNTAASGSQAGFPIASANDTYLFGFQLDVPVTFGVIEFNVSTADTAAGSACGAFADCYAVGIYNAATVQRAGQTLAAGTLVAHCAPMALNATGPDSCGTIEATQTLQPGAYYFALTGDAATAEITYASGNISFLSDAFPTANGTTNGGSLNVLITPPPDSWTFSNVKNIVFGLSK